MKHRIRTKTSRVCTARLWPLVVALAVLPHTTRAADVEQAVNLLTGERHLTRFGGSSTWITDTELRLHNRLERVPEWNARILSIGSDLDGLVGQNERVWQQLQSAEKALRDNKRSLSTAQRKQLTEQIERLRKQSVAPEKLGGRADVRLLLVELTNLRNEILIATAWAREQLPLLQADYRRLRQDGEIASALLRIGPKHRLGPVDDYQKKLQRLDQCKQFVLARPVPLYVQSGRARVGGIANDRFPLTFTWRESSEPTFITANMAAAMQLEIPDGAPTRPIRVGSERILLAKPVTIAYLRFGPCVLRDVQALVLPPEGEDVGAQIGPVAFDGYQVEAAAKRLHLAIRAEP